MKFKYPFGATPISPEELGDLLPNHLINQEELNAWEEKNIGITWHLVPMEIQNLCDNTAYLFDQKSFSPDEITIRFRHQLVFIHPFPNGNGRHSRLMADLLTQQQGFNRFSWGLNQNLRKLNSVRRQYIEALQNS